MEKINIAELLKDCPQGMELDCTMYDGLEFDSIDESVSYFPIKCRIKCQGGGYNIPRFSKYGLYDNTPHSKCVIFPKGKTTWEGFVPPCKFKDGDVITNDRGNICIYKNPMFYNKNLIDFYCGYRITDCCFLVKHFGDHHFGDIKEYRFATEEEKQKLLQIIKANGYKWDTKTKTLEELIDPKFKVGDVIQNEDSYKVTITEVNIEDELYFFESITKGIGSIYFNKQDNWELVPNKFDITTLVPFESRVLVRTTYGDVWKPAIYGYTDSNRYYIVGGAFCWRQCIPYEGNRHLLGKTDDCDDYYKNW